MKLYKIILTVLLGFSVAACSPTKNNESDLKIVTSFFPVHSLVEEMVVHFDLGVGFEVVWQ